MIIYSIYVIFESHIYCIWYIYFISQREMLEILLNFLPNPIQHISFYMPGCHAACSHHCNDEQQMQYIKTSNLNISPNEQLCTFHLHLQGCFIYTKTSYCRGFRNLSLGEDTVGLECQGAMTSGQSMFNYHFLFFNCLLNVFGKT